MIPITDFEKRSFEGPYMSNNEFDDKLMYAAMDLVEKYDLNFDLNTILADDERADRVFQAATEFLAQVGVYNRTSSHVIRWSENEVRELVDDYKMNPRSITVGVGKEQYTISARTTGDGKTPVIWAGGGPLFNAQFIEPSILAYVKEPSVKGFTKAGCVANVCDMRTTAGCPSELLAQQVEADTQLAALKKVGRPGMFLGNINCPAPVAGALCIRPGRYESSQCMMGVHIAPEQKLDWTRLQSALICEDLGVTPWASAMSMVGGLAGGPGGAAMCATANMLAQLSYSHSPWCNIAMADMNGSSKTALTLASISVILRAAERHLSLPTGVPCCDSTVSSCYEEGIIAGTLIAIVSAASSAAVNWLTGTSPLTARIQDDAMRNISSMKLNEVEPIVHNMLDLLAKVQKEHEGQQCPFPQQLFFSIYDMKTLEPKSDYKNAVENAVALMREAGVPLSSSLSLE